MVLRKGMAVASSEKHTFAVNWAKKQTEVTGDNHLVMSSDAMHEVLTANEIVRTMYEFLESISDQKDFQYAVVPMHKILPLKTMLHDHMTK